MQVTPGVHRWLSAILDPEAMDEQSTRIRIRDLGCVADAIGLERRLARLAGVLAATVNPADDTVYLRFDAFVTSPRRIVGAIEAAGFHAAEPVTERHLSLSSASS